MAGGSIAEVVSSKAPGFAPGDIAFGDTGWQDYAAVPARHLTKMPRMEPMTHLLSVYGIAGLTAYFGLLHVGKPKEGETVVVSAAAGSVGSIVGQIAKIKGCNVIGIAGGKDKCQWLTSELGFDAAVDYKDGATFKALRACRPKGIDVYFDNVGGDILEACLSLMNNRGRIACCGAISQYDGVPSAHGPRGVPGLIVVKRLIMQGFIVMDYMDQSAAALADLQSWVASGKLKVQEDVIDGIENTPKAADRPARRRETRQADGEGVIFSSLPVSEGRRPSVEVAIEEPAPATTCSLAAGALVIPSPSGKDHCFIVPVPIVWAFRSNSLSAVRPRMSAFSSSLSDADSKIWSTGASCHG
jgi:NADPH-dependent curcumin reductase CurA